MFQVMHRGGVAKPGQPRRTQDYMIQMGDPVPKGFVGSNPTPSTSTTVRIPDAKFIQIDNVEPNVCQKPKVLLERYHDVPIRESRNHMRDIYNREKKLSNWKNNFIHD